MSVTPTSPKGLAALSFVVAGHAVFPCWWPLADGRCACGKAAGECKAGKHPLGPLAPNGVLNATTDPFKILEWWNHYPEANIGRAAGEHELVLDVDPDKGGADTLAALEDKYGPLPETLEAISGSGGRHLFFTLPAGVHIGNAVGFAPGLDTRTKGGYVIAAGSTHASGGRYEWDGAHHPDDGTPIAPAPTWLINVIRQGSPAAKASAAPGTTVAEALSGIADGQRDVALFNLTCKLHRAGVPEEWALRLVSEAAQNCTPGFSTAIAAEKVRRIYGNEPVDPLGGAGTGDPMDLLQRRVWDLEEKILRLEERDKQRRQIIANPGIEAATKLVGLEMIERADYHRTKNGGQGGPSWIANASISKSLGLSPKCVGRHVKILADQFGVINRTLEYHQTPDRLETRQFVDLPAGGVSRAAAVLATATVPDTTERRRHGGRREWCALHPDAPIRITEDRRRTCTECGEIIDEEHTERTVMRRALRLEGAFRDRRRDAKVASAPPTHHGHTGTVGASTIQESPPTQDGQAYSPRRIATHDGHTGATAAERVDDLPPTQDGQAGPRPAPATWESLFDDALPSADPPPTHDGYTGDVTTASPPPEAVTTGTTSVPTARVTINRSLFQELLDRGVPRAEAIGRSQTAAAVITSYGTTEVPAPVEVPDVGDDDWPPVEEVDTPDADWAAIFDAPPTSPPQVDISVGEIPPTDMSSSRPPDPEVARLRAELAEIRRKREGSSLFASIGGSL